jgi:hypothetical protein
VIGASLEKLCEFCGAALERKTRPDGRLEAQYHWDRRRFCGNHCSRSSKRRDFWERVEKTDTCWIWIGARSSTGYGSYGLRGGGAANAHRYAYELLRGAVADGRELDHLCRNRLCVNPDHLEPVTHAENARRGAGAKLTPAQVDEIRHRRALGERVVALGREFGVHHSQISRVARGVAWRTA